MSTFLDYKNNEWLEKESQIVVHKYTTLCVVYTNYLNFVSVLQKMSVYPPTTIISSVERAATRG